MFGSRHSFQKERVMRKTGLEPAGNATRRLAWQGAYRLLALALLLALPAGTHSQSRPAIKFGPPDAKTNRLDPTDPISGVSSAESERLLVMLNAARQKSLISDSEKLLKLARQLNEEVAAAKGGPLTQEQLRKVARIEKLAHNVKEEMSNSVRGIEGGVSELPAYER
jgi:hypothetical protein